MPKKKTDANFSQSFQELETLAAWFENGEFDLDKGLVQFERAMQLARDLKQRLSEAENRIKEIREAKE